MALTDQWHRLKPKQKSILVLALVGIVITLVAMLTPQATIKREQKRKPEEVGNFLTDTNTRELSIEGLGIEMRKLMRENRELRAQMADIQQNPVLRANKQIERLQQELMVSNQQMAGLKRELEQIRRRKPEVVTVRETAEETTKEPSVPAAGMDDLFRTPSLPAAKPREAANLFDRPPETSMAGGGKDRKETAIRFIVAAAPEKPNETHTKGEGFYIPAGTMMEGVLLTGLDAPTGRSAQSNPHPVLVRVKHEAIMPNRFRSDFRECFIVAGGYGDLSSERAYLRSERLSCISEDGGVVDVKLEAFASGGDGKVGLRGRLVSKQGQVLNKALLAGMAQGFSSMFQKTPVPVIQTNPDSKATWQTQFSTDRMAAAAFSGIGSALDKLAEFYLDQAEQMFPIIEVNAGRKVIFVLTTGRKINFG